MKAIQEFASKRPHLFWFTKNYSNLSDEAIVEGVLEYGDYEDVLEMLELMGRPNVAQIFFKKIGRSRNNFSPKIKNYFKLFFKQNA